MNETAITSAIQKRDAYRKRLAQQLTPGQRVARAVELSNTAFQLLQSSREGWKSFLQRNYRARAIQSSRPETSHGQR